MNARPQPFYAAPLGLGVIYNADLDSRVADPGLRGDSRGGYTFPVDSPASQLGIQPVGMPYPGTPPGPTW